jgi:hypothetical protein
MVERVNASIATMLSMYVSSVHKDWPDQLPSITLAINTHHHRSIGTNPYYLTYGRPCVLPGDIPVVIDDEVKQANRWRQTQELAKLSIEKMQQQNKKQYDLRRRDGQFKTGDKVMVYSPNREVKKAAKLMHLWNGPYVIKSVKTPLVYEIQLDNRTDSVHISRLKPWKERISAIIPNHIKTALF